METKAHEYTEAERAGRRAAFKTVPAALLSALALCLLMVGPLGTLIVGGISLLGLPGLLFLVWYLGGIGGTQVLREKRDATAAGFLMSAGSMLGAALSGSALYAIMYALREQEIHVRSILDQFMGPLYFLMVLGLPVCVILGMIIGWLLRREVGPERAPFRPLTALLLMFLALAAAIGVVGLEQALR